LSSRVIFFNSVSNLIGRAYCFKEVVSTYSVICHKLTEWVDTLVIINYDDIYSILAILN